MPRSVIQDKTEEKNVKKQEYLKQKEEERKMFEQYIKDGKIIIEELSVINSKVRKMILKLIGRANQSGVGETKTDDGRKVELIYPENNRRCVLKCDDGELEMPAFVLKIDK